MINFIYQLSLPVLPALKFLAGSIAAKIINAISSIYVVAWVLNHMNRISISAVTFITLGAILAFIIVVRIISVAITAYFGWRHS